MGDVAIKVAGLGKQYRIGGTRAPYQTLRETLMSGLSAPTRWLRGERQETSTIWALDDVSFEVKKGEAVGIIGRNGAGKSTLLKILSRITRPTRGRVDLYGRVGSLLEVGTGFHPELTGRENIYLNGAILGMTRREIARKFDEIVDFAEIEKFLDTPVKHYSSGMYVRLAFAVAAHLEPEILIVDEVLAVGDAVFQKKSLGKMGEAARGGGTVLFVSHNMQAIRKLCKRSLVLESGRVAFVGEVGDGIRRYLSHNVSVSASGSAESLLATIPSDPVFRFMDICVLQGGTKIGSVIGNGDPLQIEMDYQVFRPTIGLRVFFDLCDQEGTILFRSFNDEDNVDVPRVLPGSYKSSATIPANVLSPARYELIVYATIHNERYCAPKDGVHFLIDVERTGKANQAYAHEPIRGKLAPQIPWTTVQLDRPRVR